MDLKTISGGEKSISKSNALKTKLQKQFIWPNVGYVLIGILATIKLITNQTPDSVDIIFNNNIVPIPFLINHIAVLLKFNTK